MTRTGVASRPLRQARSLSVNAPLRRSSVRAVLTALAARFAAAMIALPSPAQAQQAGADAAAAGVLVPRRVTSADTTRSYALFLPPAYDGARSWPALILMDPRGRALLPLEVFRPAASNLGYVILSSYDTSSDRPTSFEDSEAAVEAMVNDAAATLSLDLHRLYLVGFSGTARLAWLLASSSPDHFPAIVSLGAALLPSMRLVLEAEGKPLPPAFLGAGTLDFNYGEVWHAAEMLDGRRVDHAVVSYPGPHGWPPASVAGDAVEWLELLAQRTGLAPVDSSWVRARFSAGRDAAATAEDAGRLHDAFLAYSRLAASFQGLDAGLGAAVDSAGAAAARLGRARDVRRTGEALHRWIDRETRALARVEAVTRALEGRDVPSLSTLARDLDLDALHRRLTDSDTLGAQAAARSLALAYVNAGFYIPRALLARGDTAAAVRSLELAHRIQPGARAVCRAFDGVAVRSERASKEMARFCAGGD